MERFGFGRQNSDPWFRIGNFDVSTTALIVGLGILSMFLWAAEGTQGPIFKMLWLLSDGVAGALGTGHVLNGQIWRLVTWPIPNEPDIWTLLLFAVFFMLGSQLEGLMGRQKFTTYIALLVVFPAVVVTLLGLLTGIEGGVAGLRFLELGVLVGFAAQWPTVKFWGIIPAPIIAGVIVGVETLQFIGLRDEYSITFLFVTVIISLLAIRSLGFADELEFIPRLPLPGTTSARGTTTASRPTTSARKRGKRKGIRVVPPVDARKNDLQDMEIDVLLDQVANEGLDSLTKAQRKRLEDHSKRLRKKDE